MDIKYAVPLDCREVIKEVLMEKELTNPRVAFTYMPSGVTVNLNFWIINEGKIIQWALNTDLIPGKNCTSREFRDMIEEELIYAREDGYGYKAPNRFSEEFSYPSA